MRSTSWLFTVLLLLGALVQGCSNQSGSNGPANPAGQTGGTDAAVLLDLSARPGPGGGQFIITVLVQSIRGRPVEGVQVTLLFDQATTGGSLNPTSGVTDHNGKFTSVVTCDGPSTVRALAEGLTAEISPCGDAAEGGVPAAEPGTSPPKS